MENINLGAQATLRIVAGAIKIYIDPFQLKAPDKADLILITHPHFDHFDLESIKKVYLKGCIVCVPHGCEKLHDVAAKEDIRLVEPDQQLELKGIKIKTVPAYNNLPGRMEFHPRENKWVGYVLEANGQKIYHAGDTDHIEEMAQLNGSVDISFLPVGGTYTMDASQAAAAVQAIAPAQCT